MEWRKVMRTQILKIFISIIFIFGTITIGSTRVFSLNKECKIEIIQINK